MLIQKYGSTLFPPNTYKQIKLLLIGVDNNDIYTTDYTLKDLNILKSFDVILDTTETDIIETYKDISSETLLIFSKNRKSSKFDILIEYSGLITFIYHIEFFNGKMTLLECRNLEPFNVTENSSLSINGVKFKK